MPELPEVETVARQLAPAVTGRRVRRVTLFDDLLRNGRVPATTGRTIEAVSRWGKQVMFRMSPAHRRTPLWLLVHLRMTGRLVWKPGRAPRRDAVPHLRARLTLDGGSLLFIDTRRFGTFRWETDPEALVPDFVDPTSSSFTAARLGELLAGSRSPLKVWLLRQDRLVGLGNIYASEILHAARLSPTRPAGSLSAAEIRRLHGSTRRILKRAIENCGTTFSDFQDARGEVGSYQAFLKVYDREEEPCRRCREPIVRLIQQQRSTFYCRSCQR